MLSDLPGTLTEQHRQQSGDVPFVKVFERGARPTNHRSSNHVHHIVTQKRILHVFDWLLNMDVWFWRSISIWLILSLVLQLAWLLKVACSRFIKQNFDLVSCQTKSLYLYCTPQFSCKLYISELLLALDLWTFEWLIHWWFFLILQVRHNPYITFSPQFKPLRSKTNLSSSFVSWLVQLAIFW